MAHWLTQYYNSGTRRVYAGALTALAAFAQLDLTDLTALTAEQAAGWVGDMLAQGLSVTTVRTRLAAARAFYVYLVEMRMLEESPFARVKQPRGSRRLRGRALTREEAAALWQAARMRSMQPERDVALLEVALRCGLRRAELAALTWDNVRLAGLPHLVVVGKGNKERLVKLQPPTVEALQVWRAALNGRGAGGGRVFALSGSGIYKLIVRRAREAEIEPISPHDLRRTFVTRTLDGGAELERVQEAAGHATPATTRLYDLARRELTNAPGDYLDWEL